MSSLYMCVGVGGWSLSLPKKKMGRMRKSRKREQKRWRKWDHRKKDSIQDGENVVIEKKDGELYVRRLFNH